MLEINDRTLCANTQFFALIGKKLTHSLSVPIHRMFFEETGIAGAYRLVEVPEDRLAEAVAAFELLGFQGFNVTIPYKQAVVRHLRGVDGVARRIGAVNTVCRATDGLHGYNTDVAGFLAMLRRMGVDVTGRDCAILGASGGAAQAAIEALLSLGARRLYLVTREPAGRTVPDARAEWIDYSHLEDISAALLVNCTPVGMYPNAEASPLPAALVGNFAAVADMIYNPLETQLLRDARAAGIPTQNGLYMLVAQAIAAQELWQGEKYPPELIERIFERLHKGIQRGDF